MNSGGKLIFHIFASLAEFEQVLMLQELVEEGEGVQQVFGQCSTSTGEGNVCGFEEVS